MNNYICYFEHQFIKDTLALLGNTPYECIEDKIHNRFFCVNQNNEIIYIDAFSSDYIMLRH